jgi:hypothetical protein
MVLFVAAIVIPACAFYLYAFGHFLREALQMRRQRLSVVPVQKSTGDAPVADRSRGVLLTFLPNPRRPSQRGAA